MDLTKTRQERARRTQQIYFTVFEANSIKDFPVTQDFRSHGWIRFSGFVVGKNGGLPVLNVD
jgi:hypothetical protein